MDPVEFLGDRRPPAQRLVRSVLGVTSLAVAVLGFLGLKQLSADMVEAGELDEGFSALTLMFGMLQLFGGGGSLANVPLALAVARLLAPIITLGALLSVVAQFAQSRLATHSFSRWGKGHTVLVGTLHRLKTYLADTSLAADRVAYLGPEPGYSGWHFLHVQSNDYSGDAWLNRLRVRHAARVVIATGSDADNLTLLAELISGLGGGRGAGGDDLAGRPGRMIVEIDDPETALQLAIGLMTTDRPGGSRVEVICPVSSRALIAAAQLEQGADRSPRIAIVGDGPTTATLGLTLAERFEVRATAPDGSTPCILLTELAPSAQLLLQERIESSAAVKATACPSIDELALEIGSWTVFVEHADREQSARAAIELATKRPEWNVILCADGGGPPIEQLGLGRLTSFTTGLDQAGELVDCRMTADVFTLVAMQRFDTRVRHGDPFASDRWELQPVDVQRRLIDAVRHAVAQLLGVGYRLAPLLELWPIDPRLYRRCIELPIPIRHQLDGEALGLCIDNLPMEFKRAGVVLLEPIRDDDLESCATPRPHSGRARSLEPSALERIARQIHLGYQRHHVDPSHPAAKPWEELSDELKAQNLGQARQNTLRLAALGYDVRLRTDAVEASTLTIDPPTLERLAREEHDRWAHEKRAHGFVWGPDRRSAGSDLRHPDLLHWIDLNEAVRDKDRAPIRELIDSLAEAGFIVTRLA
jgi:hypothetical protein